MTDRSRWLAHEPLEHFMHSVKVARLRQRSSVQISAPFSCASIGGLGGGGSGLIHDVLGLACIRVHQSTSVCARVYTKEHTQPPTAHE